MADEVRILTDDCDVSDNELRIMRGINGDVYLTIGPKGFRYSPHSVRLATSGGAITTHKALVKALLTILNETE
jgi:hypothetical protein